MKSRLLLFAIITITLIGCVPKSDYEKLETELEETNQELSYIKSEYEILLEEKRQAEIEKNRKPYINESQAKQYLKDYYEFYDSDMKYRNPKFRRVNDNVFTISLEECTKKGGFSNDNFFWNSRVRTLTVNNDNSYSLE